MLGLFCILDAIVLILLGLFGYGFVKESIFDKFGRIKTNNIFKNIFESFIKLGEKIAKEIEQ